MTAIHGRRLRLASLLGILIMAGGCDGGPGLTLGDAELRVVDGDGQVHPVAETDSLDQPVSAQLYRTPEGGITFRLVTPAYAQTNVVGVAGEQVCAVPVGELPLEPWNPCDITDPSGVALFWFEPGPRAGEACAEIRAVVDGERVVTDIVCATITAGEWAQGSLYTYLNIDDGTAAEIFSDTFRDAAGNSIPFELAANEGGPFLSSGVSISRAPGSEFGQTGTITVTRTDTGEVMNVAVLRLIDSDTPGHWAYEVIDAGITY